jgi:hypothetical protein
MEQRREGLPGGSEMTSEVSTPGVETPSGGRASSAVGSKVIFHGRVEDAHESEGGIMGSLHGEVKPLPKDQ